MAIFDANLATILITIHSSDHMLRLEFFPMSVTNRISSHRNSIENPFSFFSRFKQMMGFVKRDETANVS